MSVAKNLRNLSSMEFHQNALNMRKEITNWMIRDFGTTKNKKSINQVIKDIDEQDQETINEIFKKYGKETTKNFQSEYPQWFVEHERNTIMRLLQDMIENITRANSLYVSKDNNSEYESRRLYQDKAIGSCYVLYSELQYIAMIFGTDLNKFIPFLEMTEREIDLLKGWRRSDNKYKG